MYVRECLKLEFVTNTPHTHRTGIVILKEVFKGSSAHHNLKPLALRLSYLVQTYSPKCSTLDFESAMKRYGDDMKSHDDITFNPKESHSKTLKFELQPQECILEHEINVTDVLVKILGMVRRIRCHLVRISRLST